MLAWLELQARKGSGAPYQEGKDNAPAAQDAAGALFGKQPRPLQAYLALQLAKRAKKEAEAAAAAAAGAAARDTRRGRQQPAATAQQGLAPCPEATPAAAPPPASGAAPLALALGLEQLVGRTLLLYRQPPQDVWHEATIAHAAGSSVWVELSGGGRAGQWVDLRQARYHIVPQPPPPAAAVWEDVLGRHALVHWPEDSAFYEGYITAYQGDGQYIVSYLARATAEAMEEEVLLHKVTHYLLGEKGGSGSGSGSGGGGQARGDCSMILTGSLPLGKENGRGPAAPARVKRSAAAAFGSEESDDAIDIMN